MKTFNNSFFKILLMFLASTFVMCSKAKVDKKGAIDERLWNGKKSAIALTYDDGLHVHLDNVRPILNAHNLKGTFYVHINCGSFKEKVSEWKNVEGHSHELGNRTVFHPRDGKSKG